MAAGWFPDPSARHEYRYYDGTSWTDQVADAGVGTVEPFQLPPPPPAPRLQASPPLPIVQPLPPVQPLSPTTGPPTQPEPPESRQRLSTWSDQQMRSAAAWWSSRRNRQSGAEPGPVSGPNFGARPDPQVLDDTQAPSVLGQWSGLAEAVSHYAINAAGVTGTEDLVNLLRAITGSADAQSQLLHRIDAKIDALVLGPYQTGRTHLSEAARVGADDPTQLEHVRQARDCFYLAYGQAASVQSRALVEYHLAMAWLLLGRKDDAVHWFTQSYGSAMTVVQELARNAEDVRVLRSRGSTAAASYFYPAGIVVLGMKFKKMMAAEQSRDMLREFLPFVACVARSHNALTEPSAHLSALQLTSGANGHELVDITV